jgi:hypothetical protein
VGYTLVAVGEADEYSRSATACEDECSGTEVSFVALGTVEGEVLEAIVLVSSVQKP